MQDDHFPSIWIEFENYAIQCYQILNVDLTVILLMKESHEFSAETFTNSVSHIHVHTIIVIEISLFI